MNRQSDVAGAVMAKKGQFRISIEKMKTRN